jgi:hypothetical protein
MTDRAKRRAADLSDALCKSVGRRRAAPIDAGTSLASKATQDISAAHSSVFCWSPSCAVRPPHLSDLDGRRSPTIRASCDPSLSNDLPRLPRLNSATAWSRSTLVAVQGRIGPCGISDGGVLRSRSFFCSTWSFSAISSGANSQMCAQGGWGLCAAVHRPSATAAQRPLHEKEPARDQHDPPCQRRSERHIRHPGTPNTWRTGTILRSPGAE